MKDDATPVSRLRLAAIPLLIAVLAFAGWAFLAPASSPDEIIASARKEFSRRRVDAAESMVRDVLADHPEHSGALLLSGEIASKRGDLKTALDFFDRVPPDSRADYVQAQCLAGDLLFYRLYRLSDSEARFRSALEADPESGFANYGLVSTLSTCCRYREAFPFLRELGCQEKLTIPQLLQLNFAESLVADESVVDFLKQCERIAPADPLPLLGRAHGSMKEGDSDEAIRLLRRVLKTDPDQISAHVLLGRALMEQNNEEAIVAWESDLPPAADDWPDIWELRGRRAAQRSDVREAIRCYWEVLRRDASHSRALQEFPQLLISSGLEGVAQVPLQRSHQQTRLNSLLQKVADGELHFGDVREAVEILEAMGRLLEANGWAVAALQQDPNLAWAKDVHARLSETAQAAESPTDAASNPALALDFSEASPLWSRVAISANGIVGPDRSAGADDFFGSKNLQSPTSSIAFEDVAESLGLRFNYFNGAPAGEKTYRLYETTGGGVGILDYDSDGWPDIYLTQGCRWPPGTDGDFRDRLFRNVSGRRFEDVTNAAELGDEGFSQGVAVGDYDSDGFPDLYLANIGGNRLYRNRGDGTFADVSDQVSHSTDVWTTSCLMADLNNDTLPDLYSVNYVAGEDVHERVCHTPEGSLATCTPIVFDPERDDIFLNQGDGTFAKRVGVFDGNVPAGNGLGILTADFNGDGRLSVFVANDQNPNHLLENTSDSPDADLLLSEQGMLSGVAVDRVGRSQACMGVACGDVDGDGLLDLFVTNFAQEYNTLYLQQSSGLFMDATHSSGLLEPSVPYLGFGTQFLDADLDGRLDVIVANGNIDDSGRAGTMYHMRPHFFRNTDGGEFVELSADGLGSYFEAAWLGRAVALVDWNRDGREDAVVSHLDANVSLLTNKTQDAGAYLALTCFGVTSGRDAIGTTVRVTVGNRVLMRQLTAGSGYHASSERRLIVGLGAATTIDKLEVQWPAGPDEVFENVAANREYAVIEGRPVLLQRARARRADKVVAAGATSP